MAYPDVLGLNIDKGRQMIFDYDCDAKIVVIETRSPKDKVIHALSDGTIIKQINYSDSVELTIGFFKPSV